MKMFNKIDAREWGDSEVNLDLTLCRQAWIFQATKIVSLGAQLRLSLSLFSGFPTFFFFVYSFHSSSTTKHVSLLRQLGSKIIYMRMVNGSVKIPKHAVSTVIV